ncbi:hypothetical protein T484DRAFT_2592691 [Baffinella frigidus]|nr:hypothetical protein T484DRAFT_2592691 [Cryptophyta sp. CCMP2293]
MLGSALFATPPHLTTRENGTAGKNAVEYTLAPNMFGNASILVSAECDDPDAHGWLRQVVNVTLVVLPVNDAPFFLYNCSAPYHIAPATVHTTCLPRCSATAPGSALACGILLPVEENCAGCALGPSPGPSPMEGCLFPLVVPGLVYATAPSDSDAVIPEAQTLTFHITPLSPSAASRLLDARFPTPTIDVASGTLSACLAPNQHGEALFNVTLSDSGGRARSGEDSSWELLTLRIIRINIRPSFSLMLPYTLSAFDEAAAPDFTYSCSGGYGCVGPPPLPEEDDAY